MAIIRPFAALRFTIPIENAVAPPYDVISPQERESLAQSDPHNLVHLTLPEQKSDDRSQFVKYARGAQTLNEWRSQGVLKNDPKPAFYRYRQEFANPVTGERHTRTAIFALLKTEPYENEVVLPHEQTFPKHKEDRLRVLEATRTHLESIYGLYNDPSNEIASVIERMPFQAVSQVTTEDGVSHELATCDDEQANQTLQRAFEANQIWIADGHHRYETAMNFRKNIDKDGVLPEDHLMIALSSLQDPGLIVLPTHRMVKTVAPEKLSNFPSLVSDYFEVEEVERESLPQRVRELGGSEARALGVVTKDHAWLLRMKDPAVMESVVTEPYSSLWKRLDVTVLHSLVMERLIGLPKGVEAYTRVDAEVFEKIDSGEYSIGFFVNAPSVEETRDIAAGMEKMPQKSTYFYPKLLSGLVIWGFDDPMG